MLLIGCYKMGDLSFIDLIKKHYNIDRNDVSFLTFNLKFRLKRF